MIATCSSLTKKMSASRGRWWSISRYFFLDTSRCESVSLVNDVVFVTSVLFDTETPGISIEIQRIPTNTDLKKELKHL